MNPSGEVDVIIKDKTYKMRPSFKCLAAIEEACNRGISKIVADMGEGDVRHSHIASIIHCGIKYGPNGKDCPSIDEIGTWLLSSGKIVEMLSESVLPFFKEALTSGPKEN